MSIFDWLDNKLSDLSNLIDENEQNRKAKEFLKQMKQKPSYQTTLKRFKGDVNKTDEYIMNLYYKL